MSKLCTSCEYMDWHRHICHHDKAVLSRSLVDGSCQRLDCETMRKRHGLCGVDAALFELRKPMEWKVHEPERKWWKLWLA
jgi:hypothetical protein